jgi:SRSO17 transposase
MTTDEVRAAASTLVDLHGRFAPLFGYSQAQGHALTYLQGLLLGEGRRSVEPMALNFGDAQVSPLQKFLTYSPWDERDIQREIQNVASEALVPSTSQWSLGSVGVIDESSFPKKGDESVGVDRQWCGRLGKKDNCQVGVFLVAVTPAGKALLDHQLYLPEEWILDPERRQKTQIPRRITFRTKPELALDLLRRTQSNQIVSLDWLTFDELYGRNQAFLEELELRRYRYVGEVPVTTTVWTQDPATQIPEYSGRGPRPTQPVRDSVQSVEVIAAQLPAAAWTILTLRDGACQPVTFAFARVRVWAMRDGKAGPPIWLLIRQSLSAEPELKYYVSNGATEVSLETLALVSGCRVQVEEYLEDSKSYLGMAHYEARAWTSWHHHMSLVALAYLAVTLTRLQLKKTLPGSVWTWPFAYSEPLCPNPC